MRILWSLTKAIVPIVEVGVRALELDADEMSNSYAPREFEWCETLDDRGRIEATERLKRRLQDVGAAFVADGRRCLLLFRLTEGQKEKLAASRFNKFLELTKSMTLRDFVAGNNHLMDVKDALSDSYGDAVVMEGDRFLSSMDSLRAIEPDEWYVASPVILMH